MRISVPTIPHVITPSTAVPVDRATAVARIAAFIGGGKTALLTGAGVSVDSGIRAYRGQHGRYLNPNYKPILYHELVEDSARGHSFRQRYWLRSYLGYPPVRDTQPNPTHYAFAALQHTGHIRQLVTQNVDGLHLKALRGVPGWDASMTAERILELHGTLFKVHCKHGHQMDRDEFQDMLSIANPQWKAMTDGWERTGQKPRTNPDGDVAIEGIDYTSFVVPPCPTCATEGRANNVHKPEVVFFGESIPQAVKERSFADITACDRLLIAGTTLATYSAFRLLKHALEFTKPVLIVNLGPTRAEGMPGIEKLEVSTGTVMRDVVHTVLGMRAQDPVISRLLESGIVAPPPEDDDDRVPRAAG